MEIDCDNTIPFWPILYYKKNTNHTRLHLLWPLITWNARRDSSTFALFYILFRYTISPRKNRVFVDLLWPILHYEASTVDDSDWSFHLRPFIWFTKRPNKTLFTLGGLLLYYRKETYKWFHLLPFIIYTGDRNFSKFFTPIFMTNRTRTARYIFFVLPPIYIRKPYHEEGYTFVVFPFLWIFRGSGVRKTVALLPAFVYRRESETEHGFTIAFLIWYTRKSEKYRFIVVPFIWYFHYSDDEYKLLLLPIYCRSVTPSSITNGFGMLIWYTQWHNSSRSRFLILPFLWYIKNSDTEYYFVLAPFIWLFHTGEDDYMFIVFPFIYYTKNSSDDIRFIFIPFIYYRKNTPSSKFILFPVIWYFKRSHDEYRLFVFPSFYKAKTPSAQKVHLWPIFGFTSNGEYKEYSVVYPLIIVRKYHDGKFEAMILFPLIYENVTRILPLYSNKITPEIEQGFALLYVWKYVHRKTIRVQEQGEEMSDIQSQPTLRSENDYYSYNCILPLFFLYRSDHIKKCIFIPLLYYRFHNQTKDQYLLLPGFYRKRQNGQLRQMFFIFFYHFENAVKKRIFSPFYIVYQNTPGPTVQIILPIYFNYVKGERYIAIYPFYIVYRNNTLEVKFRLPFYYYQKDNDSEIKYFFPVYGRVKKGEDSVKHMFLFPVYSWHRNVEKKEFEVNFLWPLLHYENTPTKKSMRIWPFYHHYFTDKLDFVWVALLFWYFKTDKSNKNNTFMFLLPVLFYRSNIDFSFTLFAPLLIFPPYFVRYIKKSDNSQITSLWPLYGSAIESETPMTNLRKFLTKAVLFAKYENTDSGYKTIAIFLLWWRYINDQGTKIICLLYLYPPILSLFKYENTPGKGTVHYLFPVYHRQSTQQHYSFSLLWFWKPHWISVFCYNKTFTADLDTMDFVSTKLRVWLFPLFYSRKDHETLFSMLYLHPDYFTTYKNYKTVDFHRLFLFPLFYKQDSTSDSPNQHKLFSLVWIAHPVLSLYHSFITRQSTLRRITIIWWYFKTEEELYIQLLYIVPRWVSIYKYYSREDLVRRFIFPLFYSQTTSISSITSLFWLFHPSAAAFCKFKNSDVTMSWLVIVYWYKNTGDVILQLLWIFPEWVSIYKYFRSVDHDIVRYFIFPIYYNEKARERTTTAALWLFHPMAACYHNTKSSYKRVWLLPLFWYKKDQETYFQLAWIIPRWISVFKYYKSDSFVRHWIFLVYHKENSSEFSRFALVWLFDPKVSIYYKWTMASDSLTWLFPVFWKRDDGDYELNMIWIVPRWVTVFKYSKSSLLSTCFLFLVFYRRKEDSEESWSFIWLFHYKASFIHKLRDETYGNYKFWIAFIYWRHNEKGSVQFCMFYIYPHKIAILSYDNGKLIIHLIYYSATKNGNRYTYLFYFFYRKLSLFHTKLGDGVFKFWLGPFLYIQNEEAKNKAAFAIFWIYSPKISPVSYVRKADEIACHVLLAFWFKSSALSTSWGILWALYYPICLIGYIPDRYGTKVYHYVLPLYFSIIKPGEGFKCLLALGLIYIKSNDRFTDFRILWRFIRIRTGDNPAFEVNPLVYYRKGKFLCCGGLMGVESKHHESKCRCCFCCTC